MLLLLVNANVLCLRIVYFMLNEPVVEQMVSDFTNIWLWNAPVIIAVENVHINLVYLNGNVPLPVNLPICVKIVA